MYKMYKKLFCIDMVSFQTTTQSKSYAEKEVKMTKPMLHFYFIRTHLTDRWTGNL